jgi:hypothetical protein
MTAGYDSGLTAAEASLQKAAGAARAGDWPPGQWEEATAQLSAYFRAFGIAAEEDLNRLARQVLQRIAARVEAQTPEQRLQLAIEEAQQMLNEWLATVLALQDTSQSQTLAAARAGLRFCQETAPWPEGFLYPEAIPAALRDILQAATRQAVPTPREVPMATQSIEFRQPLAGSVQGFRQLLKNIAGALSKRLRRP